MIFSKIFSNIFRKQPDKISLHLKQTELANKIVHYEDLNLKRYRLIKKIKKYDLEMEKVYLDIKNIGTEVAL